jgi:hypothetical protein
MRQAATSKQQGRSPFRALSTRALAAAAMALVLVLQVLATAGIGASDRQGRPGAIVATATQSSADCAGGAQGGGAPHGHGAGCAHFCILCCAGADEVATRAEPHMVVAPPAPPRRSEPTERRLADDVGRPIGFMSSWSPQAPPFVS